MKSVFKQYISDFHASSLPKHLIERNVYLPVLPFNINKAWVLIGMRRSGKTWVLYQLIEKLLRMDGLLKEEVLYINFEDDRLALLKPNEFQLLLDAYFELYPHLISTEVLYLFFDEIQEIDGWEKFIRRLLDTTKYEIYISGSSAKMLSKEIATGLRGRTLTREIFPLSFIEYLAAKKISRISTSKNISLISHHLENYLELGGFPETIDADVKLHIELIQGYIETVIFRDIVDRHKITNITALKRFIQFCLQNAAAPLSINKLYQTFKTQGIQISKNSLYDYLDYFEDAYCIFSVPLFSFSQRKSTANPVKIYPVDPGIIRAYTVKDQFELAARFETTVFCQLRRKYSTIYYYKTDAGKEIDFVIENQGQLILYQVCLSLEAAATEQREVSALTEAMAELNVQESFLITRDGGKVISVETGKITVVPLWEFLIDSRWIE